MNNFNTSRRNDYDDFAQRRAEREARRTAERERAERRQKVAKRIGAVALSAGLIIGGAGVAKNAIDNTQDVQPVGYDKITVQQGYTPWESVVATQEDITSYNESHPGSEIKGNYSADVICHNIEEANPDKDSGNLQVGDTYIIPDYTPNESK